MHGLLRAELFFIYVCLAAVSSNSCHRKEWLAEIFSLDIGNCFLLGEDSFHCTHKCNFGGKTCDSLSKNELPSTISIQANENFTVNYPINDSLKDSQESTELSQDNASTSDDKKVNSTAITKQAVCNETEVIEEVVNVELVNGTSIQQILHSDPNITTRSLPAQCVLVYFFSHHCPFSVQGSPYVNALSRSLKNIPIYGLDSIEYHSMNARYGVMGTPSLVLFHNGNVAGRFNSSEYSTSALMSFIHHFTNQKVENINVTTRDFTDIDLPNEVKAGFPFALSASWIFLVSLVGYVFLTSEFYAKLSEAFLNNWREAEAQHDHQE